MTLTSSSKIDNLLELHQQDIDSKIVTLQEIMRWKEKLKKQDVALLPTNTNALEACNADLFPNVWKLLSILAALPVTTATSKHSFSVLQRLKM